MAPFSPFSNNNLHPRSDDGLSRGNISGLSIAATGVLLTALFGGWECWKRRTSRAQPVANPGLPEYEPPYAAMSSAPPAAAISTQYQYPAALNLLVHSFVAAIFQALRTAPTPQTIQLQALPSQQPSVPTPAPALQEVVHPTVPSRAVTF